MLASVVVVIDGAGMEAPPVAALYHARVNPVLGATCWVKLRLSPLQMLVSVVAGGLGSATTVTTICALGPSHKVAVLTWLTQWEVVVAVDGVGAVVVKVPPVDTGYHLRVFPALAVALGVSGVAVWPMQ